MGRLIKEGLFQIPYCRKGWGGETESVRACVSSLFASVRGGCAWPLFSTCTRSRFSASQGLIMSQLFHVFFFLCVNVTIVVPVFLLLLLRIGLMAARNQTIMMMKPQLFCALYYTKKYSNEQWQCVFIIIIMVILSIYYICYILLLLLSLTTSSLYLLFFFFSFFFFCLFCCLLLFCLCVFSLLCNPGECVSTLYAQHFTLY